MQAVKEIDDGVRVSVRLTPKGRRDAVEGLAATAAGGAEIRASVTAVPENGKANKAVIKLLSKTWKVPKTSIDLISGETDRHKVFMISGDAKSILLRIAHTFED